MESLKGYIIRLARRLDTTPAALYERQRVLVRASLLSGEGGRGPGSGVRATAESVALLLIAAISTDKLSEAEDRTRQIATAKATGENGCPLTGRPDFQGAITVALASPNLAGLVRAISVSRLTADAEITYSHNQRQAASCSKFAGDGLPSEPPIKILAELSGGTFRAIAQDVQTMADG